mmetsp:Transcript_16620/g.35914  ORF Transcript_16620/g.35914 Transcript_16620/m.35914 type:complete len:108 (-) Transcript_16620:205-528(-)|eukprot:CAMPEP_0172309536 /NCGR_PEP_ID=MMETSP1058-20130122/9977_1 /TAXON_ID=83371 /ORGANISM="Detonula confervacea, Strain CCMP 353" /LENGTH=107 /DNA_ID=CAMNT_0013022179 /DNA_START=27 /DNA_END=350 /DNA_ORIENTATION=+
MARLISFFYLLLLIPLINIVGAFANADTTIMPDANAAPDGITWPDKNLVGMTGDEAKAAVLAGDSTLLTANVEILGHDDMCTSDFREDRVRIFVFDDGKVARQPKLG